MASQVYPYQSEYAEMLRAEGYAEGLARALLRVLECRGIPVSPEVRGRILAGKDPDVMKRWCRRAVTVGSVDQVFD